MNLSNEQVADAYAIAKILGSELTAKEFQKVYSQYHNEALEELNSNLQPAKCEAVQRPY